jgi:hypothetical protein
LESLNGGNHSEELKLCLRIMLKVLRQFPDRDTQQALVNTVMKVRIP